MIESGLFVGTVRHRRFSPVAHSFTYPLFMALLDIDRLSELMRVSSFTSYNRWNWASFADRDHLGEPGRPLRERLRSDAANRGVDLPDGRILLLTHLRYLGYCFNPISLFYCFDASERLQVVLAEVRNTFGGMHTYWLQPERNSPTFRSAAAKALEVSPFMPMDLTYSFALTSPGDQLVAHVRALEGDDDVVFDATLALARRPWTAPEIRRALTRHPVMTASVIVGIHWQAMRLWWKGAPLAAAATER